MQTATIRFPRVRAVYNAPASNVSGRVPIGISGMPTGFARESALVGAVGPLGMPANGALLAGVSRVYENDWNPDPLSLVAQFGAEVEESPGMQGSPLWPTSPDPQTNALEVFQGYRSLRAFGFSYQFLGDGMVHVIGEASLLARKLLQAALGPLRAFLLKLLPKAMVAVSDPVEVRTGVRLAVAVGGDLDNAQVYAQHPLDLDRFGLLDVHRGQQVELAPHVGEVSFPLLGCQKTTLVFTANEGNSLAAPKRPDAHGLRHHFPRKHPVIVGDGPQLTKGAFGLLIQFVGIYHLGVCPHHHLSRKVELVLGRVVNKVVQGNLLEGLGFPSYARNVVTSRVEAPHGVEQIATLFGRSYKSDLGGKLHKSSIVRSLQMLKELWVSHAAARWLRFLPMPKGKGFHGGLP